jgi:hypothetical protein
LSYRLFFWPRAGTYGHIPDEPGNKLAVADPIEFGAVSREEVPYVAGSKCDFAPDPHRCNR